AAALCIGLGLRYLFAYSFPSSALAIFYTLAAFTSHFAFMGFLPWVILVFPLLVVFPIRKFIIPLCVLIASIVLCVEFLDTQVFIEHRFHFNMLTVRILGWQTWGFGILDLLILCGFNALLARNAWKRFVTKRKRLFLIPGVAATLVLLFVTHALHAWADASSYVPITRFTTYLPFFYPTVAKDYMFDHGFASQKSSREQLLRDLQKNPSSDFTYPLHPLQFKPGGPAPNILIIGIDDLRSDAINKTLAPHLTRLAESGILFNNHLSGGNSTRMGLFALFYGLPSTYWQYVESNKRSPVLVDALLDRGYAFGVFTSARLWGIMGLDVTAFARLPHLRMETKLPGPFTPFRNDSSITAEWRQWLDTAANTPGKPFFGFLFYDAVCAKNYPPSYSHRINYSPDASDARKHYDNSIVYVDSLVGIVIDDLERRKLLDKTIVLVTADHGEEFNENNLGFNGHGSAYSQFQLHVPLIALWPGHTGGVVAKRTSHNDIVATLMKEGLGCTNQTSDYCSGNDFFSDSQWNWLIVGSYYNYAVVEGQQVTVEYPGGYFEVRDRNYQLIAKPKLYSAALAAAFAEMGRFYRK
ncbi:MAG: DUF3413 domain-containing protein, partial [Chitinivibrionales bacterium]|nr:DUF3413 domain-containing protein [Chitinivibrionales bacterium]